MLQPASETSSPKAESWQSSAEPPQVLVQGSQQVTEVQAKTTTSGTLQFPLWTTDVQIMHTPSFSNVKVAVPGEFLPHLNCKAGGATADEK